MKQKLILAAPLVLVCCLFLSGKAFAAGSDIDILVATHVNSLQSESGVVAVEEFPAEVPIHVVAQTGVLTDVQLEYAGQDKRITPEYTLIVESKDACGSYTITAKTDQGAILTITANVVFQVKAIYNTRYRTTGMNISEIYAGDELLRSFPEPQHIDLADANTVSDYEQERIAAWIGCYDGGTYTLTGSLEVEVHNISSGKVYGTYDTRSDFEKLTTSYGWTQKTITAFETMGHTALSYQAPVKIDINAAWCNESKREIYGKLTAQDKGVLELLYPYQTTSVTFHKDDIQLSRNFIYSGLEWRYTPETMEFVNGESKTQTEITQKINYRIPTAVFYFKFKKCSGNDLSVVIQAPSVVKRDADYFFTVIFMNCGDSTAYDVPLGGSVDSVLIREIPGLQDFQANDSKSYTIKRTADTTEDKIILQADIGIPEGFIDGDSTNNRAMAVIKVIDPEPEKTPAPENDPDDPDQPDHPDIPDDPGNPSDTPPKPKELCDLSAGILAAPVVYENEEYSFTVSFTNHSSKALKAVSLLGKNNGNDLRQLPEATDFQPQETKTYSVTGKAGSGGEIYHLWAYVAELEGFRDESPANNTAVSKITVIKKPIDRPDNPDNPDDPGTPDKPDNPNNPDTPNNPDVPNNPDNPDKPDNPNKPEEPGNPIVKQLCDVWVNISSPPVVQEQESFSFTVYFANSSDKALSGVDLNVTINGKAVSDVPSTANFKPYEKKAYLVTSVAGEKGVPLRLLARVAPPEGYIDIFPGNNEAFADVMVLARPYDLETQRITPDRYKENQSVITTIKVSNSGSQDFTPGQNVTVLFQIPELSVSKRMDAIVMQKDSWNVVSLRWDTPNVQADKDITLVAVINPDGTLNNESTRDNNTYTQKAVIMNVVYEQPEESRVLPTPPKRQEQSKVTWWEQRYVGGQFVWKEFYAELIVSAVLDYSTKDRGYLKSGYGYSIRVTASVNTNYDKSELITAPQTAEVYLPEYRYETAIPLIRDGEAFVFKENPASPFKYRKQYIPLWFPDNKDYIVQLLVGDVHTPGGTLTKWVTGGEIKIKVVDSMYDDDITTSN